MNPDEPVTKIFMRMSTRWESDLWQSAPGIDDDLVLQPPALDRAILLVRRRQDDDVGALEQLVERHEPRLRQIGIVAEHVLGFQRGELAQLEREAVTRIVAVRLEGHPEDADGLLVEVLAQALLDMLDEELRQALVHQH